jgi:hypothetical protein
MSHKPMGLFSLRQILLLYINAQKVHGSNLVLDTDYPNRGITSLSSENRGNILKRSYHSSSC